MNLSIRRLKINKIHVWVFLGLFFLNLAFFSFNLNNFFLSDDFDWLNLTQQSQQSIWYYFGSNYYGEIGQGGSYRPMVNLLFWLNYKIGGLNPLPYHLTNLIFHIGVCFLVYLLVLLLLGNIKEKNKIAVLAAVFFAILPNHSEAVIWIAAVADPVATFFYLLAFYLYLIFRRQKSFLALIISVLSFLVALLTKEIAITLPLLIIVWELYQYITKAQGPWLIRKNEILKNIILYPFGYWLLVFGYFLMRYSAIGLIFGYYARSSFKIDFGAIYKMMVALLTDLFFYGKLRVILTDYFVANKIFFVLLVILLAVLVLYTCRKYFYKAAFLIDAYLILILPVLFLAFNNLNDEGERYNYLPSVAFVILLSLLIWQIKEKYLRNILMVSLIFYFAFNLLNKNYNWQLAADLNQKLIIEDAPQVLNLSEQNYLVGLPDNLAGVPLLRNGFVQAVNLFRPELEFEATVLNAYQILDRKNYKKKILYWGAYPTGGYIAETFDHNNWVTGFDRRETENYIFELWHYDYPTYASDTIRLIFKDSDGDFIKAGDEDYNILIYDRGDLKPLKNLIEF